MTKDKKEVVENVWLDAFLHKLPELASGRCDLARFSAYLEQLDSMENLIPLTVKIRSCSIEQNVFFENLKNSQEGLLKIQTDPKYALGKAYSAYSSEMKRVKIPSSSDVAMSYAAYELARVAYQTVYEVLGILMKKAAELQDSKKFTLSEKLLKYIEMYFLDSLSGNQMLPAEEKAILQFVVRGNLAGIGQKDAEELISLTVDVIKWGYFYEHFGMPEAFEQYKKALSKFLPVYAAMNKRIYEILYP